jgi:hypothetical protein
MVFDVLRYTVRSPMPGVREALSRLAERHAPIVVTARHSWAAPMTERWLVKHGLRPLLSGVFTNQTRLPPAAYKLLTLRSLDVHSHVEDDGSIALYLARHGIRQVYLHDWPRNRNLPYPSSVRVVSSLTALADELTTT